MRTIGLTGGIGSGKSTVARLLEDLGAHVIHADLVGHEVYQPQTEGWNKIVEAFGRDAVGPDGTIDRKRLGDIVFADPVALKCLNAIVHPLIFDEVKRRIAARRQAGFNEAVVFEAAVLIEASWTCLVGEIWVVVASRDAIVERLWSERSLDAEQIDARIAAQLSDDERRCHADVVIDNHGSLAELEANVRAAWARVVRE
jgi:dephospho-CoA kinase